MGGCGGGKEAISVVSSPIKALRSLLVPVTITFARQNHILPYNMSIHYPIHLKLAHIHRHLKCKYTKIKILFVLTWAIAPDY